MQVNKLTSKYHKIVKQKTDEYGSIFTARNQNLCEILNLWGRRVGKMCTYLSFVLSLPLFPDCRRLSPHVLWWADHWGVYGMVDFAVMGTSFTICHHFITHVLLLFPSPLFPGKKCSELWHWKKKSNSEGNVLKKTLLKTLERMPILTWKMW